MSAPDNASSSPTTSKEPSVAELQADIEQTRQQLGDTVDALAAKLDFKSRAKDKVSATMEQLKDRAVTPGHRQRLTLLETGDVSLALTLVGLLAAAVVLWRRWSR
jgi:hypothetical protein